MQTHDVGAGTVEIDIVKSHDIFEDDDESDDAGGGICDKRKEQTGRISKYGCAISYYDNLLSFRWNSCRVMYL